MTQAVGILAGAGELPVIVAQGIGRQNKKRVVIGLVDNISHTLISESDEFERIAVGQLQKCIDHFKKHDVADVILCGQIDHTKVFHPDSFDPLMLSLIQQDNRAEAILGRICAAIEKQGIAVGDLRQFLGEHLVSQSLPELPQLDSKQKADVEFGWPIALQIAELNIGQSIIVNKGVVIAVEAIEGTSNMIQRTAGFNISGSTVIKIPMSNKDPRFDIPVIGSQTIDSMAVAGASVLVVAKGHTIIIDPENCQRLAKEHGIAIIAKELPGDRQS